MCKNTYYKYIKQCEIQHFRKRILNNILASIQVFECGMVFCDGLSFHINTDTY